MAPIKSSLARSVGKFLGVFKDTDLSLRGDRQSTRFIEIPFVASGGNLANALAPGNGYKYHTCLLYTSPSPRDISGSRMPSSA